VSVPSFTRKTERKQVSISPQTICLACTEYFSTYLFTIGLQTFHYSWYSKLVIPFCTIQSPKIQQKVVSSRYLTNVSIYNSTGEYRVSRTLIGLEFSYISLYLPRGEHSSSESTFHCFSLLVVSKFVQFFISFFHIYPCNYTKTIIISIINADVNRTFFCFHGS
jgi:hypothetical protein